MKNSKTMMSLLAAAAICASPAYANWFSNPSTNTNLNVGSAPNPTPADLRAVGDSPYTAGPRGSAIPHSSGHYGEPARLHSGTYDRQSYATPRDDTYLQQTAYHSGTHPMTAAQMTALEGKAVLGAHGTRLGYILAVDHASHMAEIQTPSGIGVAVSTMLLSDDGNHVAAPTMSKSDMMAMAKTQTGRTVAMNMDMRHMKNSTFRG